MRTRNSQGTRRQAFTLIEVLVVMAITAILLGLILGPLMQGFDLTQRAQVQVQAQATARSVTEHLERDLANAVYVFDNSNRPVNLWVRDGAGAPMMSRLDYALVDYVPPAYANDQNPGYTGSIDPTTGLPSDRSTLALPVAPGRIIVRCWLGLKDNSTVSAGTASGRPIKPYFNFFDDPKGASFEQHNPVILYQATVSPYTPTGQVDTRLLNVGRFGNLAAALADPNFYYDNDQATGAMPGWKDWNKDGRVNYSENWRAVARALVPTDKADMVIATRDRDKKPVFDTDPATGVVTMRLNTLARFQPTYIGNDPGAPSAVTDAANEQPYGLAPSTSVESYGHWAWPYRVYVYRSALNSAVLSYFTWSGSGNVRYMQFDTSSGAITNGGGAGEDTGFDPLHPTNLPISPVAGRFLMVSVDDRRGTVGFAFPHWITQGGKQEPTVLSPGAVNAEFNYARSQASGQLSAIRYASLQIASDENPTGVTPVLNPSDANPVLSRIPDARIVPGSETVTGPDQRPGPNYGRPIAYTRVARRQDPKSLGLNEYMINYGDVSNANLTIADPDPRIQAMRRAVQRVGTIIFNSQEDAAGTVNSLPTQYVDNAGTIRDAADITVTFQVQNNRSSDVVKADYLTRQLMTFALGVRLYEKHSGQPQQVSLTQKIRVRNLQR